MSFIPGANVGPYRIVEQAERNGVATTYTAYQPSLGRYVAVVVVPSIDHDDMSLVRQYQRQIELAMGLRHPNILAVLDHGEHLGVPFVVTELVDAEPLSERLGAPWPLTEVTRIMKPIAAGLDYAHQQGAVHGDLRSSMVLLMPDGTPILSGFGQVTRRLTAPSGVSNGEPGRRTPSVGEDIARAQQADRRGLALIAYEMLTGRTVEADPSDLERPLPPAKLGSPLVAAPIEQVFRRELTGDAAERYATASAFVADLAAPADPERPVAAPPPPPLAAAPSAGADTRRRLITVALIVAAVAVLGTLALLLRGGDTSRPIASTARGTATEAVPPGSAAAGASAAGTGAGVAANGGAGSSTGTGAGTASAAAGSATSAGGTTARPGEISVAGAQSSAAGATGVGQATPGSSPETGTGPDGRSLATVMVPTPDVAAVAAAAPASTGAASQAASGTPQGAAPSANVAAQPPTTGAPPTAAPAPAATARPGPGTPGAAGSTRLPATWRVIGDPSGRWAFDDQGRVAGRTESGASMVLFPESVDDVGFTASVSTTSCQASLVFRAQDDENLLMAIYIPDGLPNPGTAGGGVWLYQRVEGLDLPIRAVRPSTVRPAGEPVRLKIVTSGPQIAIFLNDEPALQAVDTAPRSGKLGLMVYSTSGRLCEATFGDIER
jgi:hypothetical protein